MLPYQERVVQEKADLDKKRAKLKAFRSGDSFRDLPLPEQCRLDRQYFTMLEYSRILGERIANFAGSDSEVKPE